MGATALPVTVRDPMIAEALLPRFLAPGDEARLGVLMQNIELPAGEGSVQLSVEGPLAIAGDSRLAAQLQPGAQVVRTTTLRATGVGRGIIRMAVTGPGGFNIQRETAILVRSARPPVTLVSGAELAPGAETSATPALDRMLPGTALASLTAGGAVRYDVQALLQALDDYPLFCLEQAGSKGLPLALLPTTPDRAARLQSIAAVVLDKQRFDGGFGLWSANGEAQTWLSAYATEFLLRARTAGAPVPDVAIADAMKFLAGGLEDLPSSPDGGRGAGVLPLRPRIGRPTACRRQPRPGGTHRHVADPARQGPTRRRAGADQRPRPRRSRLRCRARRARAAGLGRRPRQRAPRPTRHDVAPQGERPARG